MSEPVVQCVTTVSNGGQAKHAYFKPSETNIISRKCPEHSPTTHKHTQSQFQIRPYEWFRTIVQYLVEKVHLILYPSTKHQDKNCIQYVFNHIIGRRVKKTVIQSHSMAFFQDLDLMIRRRILVIDNVCRISSTVIFHRNGCCYPNDW